MATKDGKIVDEINGIISSRDSIRTTMVEAGVYGVTNSSKLADLAVNLANAKLPAAAYTIAASDSVTIPAGKLTTGNQTITAKSLASQTPGTAAAGDILSGKIAWVDGAKVTGNIATVTPSATELDCGKSASISKGYLASAVTITANSLASQTPGTAAAGDIRSGKIAWVDGAKVTGNIATVTPSATSLNCGASATIAKGYLASAVTITANSLASQTPGTAAAGDIRSGKTAWVGGTQVNGTMPDGTYSASVSTTNGSASMTATGVSATTSSNCYVTLSTTPGSAKGTATVGTGGYITAGSKESSPTSVSVSGNGDRLYLAINYYYTSLEAPSSTTGYNDGDIWLVVNPDV